ncbi:hypothetical protein TcasGA2_TC032077 [Tribolium castaneum]|uniref:Uncharacterized protein n=1 Tax=Tribolium castaneum TaxID=7070 RepID=A0A139WMD0_TRICA|nr:hypothetical protein TcasGA2_TC032077 [Tribolium castaneum]
MIDWVSIVRHSRRRFSNYMYGVPNKVRRKRRAVKKPVIGNGNSNSAPHTSNCSCCWSDRVEKSRYAEEEMPPPPSPPLLRETVIHDNVSRQGSLERGGRRKSSIDRDQIIKETHKPGNDSWQGNDSDQVSDFFLNLDTFWLNSKIFRRVYSWLS